MPAVRRQESGTFGGGFMWNKANEAKPSLPTPEVAAPAVSTPVPELAPAAPASRVTSKISAGLKIHGDVFGESDLYVDGEVQGKIRLANSRLTIGPNGRVQAEMEAREIVVEGSVQGNLKASEGVHLGSASRVVGSILTPRIGIDDGARLRGKVETIPASPSQESTGIGNASETQDQPPVTVGAKVE
jgi:cytoskeletal protein CcmA (bactofilin family)